MRLAMLLLAATATMPAIAATTMFQVQLTGASEVPGPGDAHGSGQAELTFDPAAGKVCYMLHAKDLTNATMAHIHKGAAGVAGPVMVPLTPPGASDNMSSGCAPLAADVLADMVANPGQYYVNVHTGALPKGAIRGQLK